MRRPPPSPRSRPSRPARPVRPEVGGAPLALPGWLDGLSDRWWGLSPRSRTIAGGVAVLLVLVASGVRVLASPYGPPAAVLVAAVDLPAGAELDGEVVRSERWPADLVPPGARSQATGTLTAPLPAGGVLTDGHVTDRGLGGLIGAGQAAVPLPAELLPPLDPGAVVQVVASAADGAGVVLADRAEVVLTDATSTWLAVPEPAAADVAAAGLRGSVTLVLVGGARADP